jgi:hypothetical protein
MNLNPPEMALASADTVSDNESAQHFDSQTVELGRLTIDGEPSMKRHELERMNGGRVDGRPEGKAGGSSLERLPDDVLLHFVLPYCGTLSDLSTLATLSTHMRKRTYSDLDFPVPTLDVCIDTYCPLCPLHKQNGTSRGAVSLLSSFPIRGLKMHCFVTDVPACLEAIALKRSAVSLELKLSNKSLSCSLESILPEHLLPANFPRLTELILDSSLLQFVNTAGRVRLLSILGRRLQLLVLSGTSSAGLLPHIAHLCPELRRLRVDRIKSAEEVEAYQSSYLEELDLRRVAFALPHLHLPALASLRYSSSARLEPAQLEQLISAMPKVTRLAIEVCSRDAELAIAAVARYLPGLTSLTLEGAHEPGVITADSLRLLGRACLFLEELRVVSLQSVAPLLLAEDALAALVHLPRLAHLTLPLSGDLFEALFRLLGDCPRLRSLVLWGRRKWLGVSKWLEVEHTLAVYAAAFPRTDMSLKDIGQLL